ncbi:DUF6507 family protein [Streptomyces violascens]|uniref:DUF6507 family protein n=1 Tax=Streptomyces violascens TaxID=67381 RepID=UPI0036608D1D
MSGWDVTPLGVRAALLKVAEEADKLQEPAAAYAESLEAAAKGCGMLTTGCPTKEGGPVGAALLEFAQAVESDLQSIPARAGKSILGTAMATTHYGEGNLEMAANAQRLTLAAPDPSLPGYGLPEAEQ